MCEVCKSEGKNYQFVNGTKNFLVTEQLYKVYKDSVASVRLCYIHSIELFMLGERRFLKEHLAYARSLITRTKRISSMDDSPFGF